MQKASLGHAVTGLEIIRVSTGVETVAKADFLPVDATDPAGLPYLRGATPGAIILQATIDIVGQVVINIDVIELG